MEEEEFHGTTTVGIVTEHGIVLGSDTRATMGRYIANTNAKKVNRISDQLGMTIAGSVADAQYLIKILSTESKLYEVKTEKHMSVKMAGNILVSMLRYRPLGVQLILGGMDYNGFHLYELDMGGSMMDVEKFTASGSGTPHALSIIEDRYTDDIELDDAVELAIRGITASIKRDSASGNNMMITVITKNMYKEYTKDEIEAIKESL